jgi:hypothetical protein
MSKTTKEDFELFKKSATKWQNALSLTNWSLYFDHKSEDMRDRYACVYWDMGAHLATIVFTKDWDDLRAKTEKEIEKVALHEVLHLVTANLMAEAEARYTSSSSIDIAEHEIIRRFEHILLVEREDAKV